MNAGLTSIEFTNKGKEEHELVLMRRNDGVTDDPHRGKAYTQADFPELKSEAERTGASLSELIRRAVDARYGRELSLDEKLEILESTRGALDER